MRGRVGAVSRNQTDAAKTLGMSFETVAQIGVLVQFRAADLHQYSLVNTVLFHLLQQDLDRGFAVGGHRLIAVARKFSRDFGKDMQVGVEAQH